MNQGIDKLRSAIHHTPDMASLRPESVSQKIGIWRFCNGACSTSSLVTVGRHCRWPKILLVFTLCECICTLCSLPPRCFLLPLSRLDDDDQHRHRVHSQVTLS